MRISDWSSDVCSSALRRAWGEVAFSADYVRMIAGQRLPDKAYRRAGLHAVLKHRPLGVVGAIAPWNGPVILAIAKIANALIAGDTLILRPSPFTPLSALRSEEHTSALQSLMRTSYAVFCLKKKSNTTPTQHTPQQNLRLTTNT